MSIISLLLENRRKGTQIGRNLGNSGRVAAIFLDATLSEQFDAPIEITKHPVEKGNDVSDHIILRPESVAIEGVITNTPMDLDALAVGLSTSVAASIGLELGNQFGAAIATASFLGASSRSNLLTPNSATSEIGEGGEEFPNSLTGNKNARINDAVEEFLSIRNERSSVSIITGLKKYESYYLSGFKVNRNKSSGGSISVSLRFQRVDIVESREATLDASAIPKVPNALPKDNQGRKNSSELNEQKTNETAENLGGGAPSILRSLTDLIGLTGG